MRTTFQSWSPTFRSFHWVTAQAAIVWDGNCHVYLGGCPGAFREVLGVATDELFPLLSGGAVASYADGSPAGRPAVTRHQRGDGAAASNAVIPNLRPEP